MFGMIGEKLGMTQVYDKDGLAVPVTVVMVEPNVVASVMTSDANGYNAIQLAHQEQKATRLSKAMQGHYKKNKVSTYKHLKEFRTNRSSEYQVGMKVTVSCLENGDKIDIQGMSKGKGFQGVMKRHNFRGGCDSHGNSVSHRVPGSIGMCTYPGRVIKGKKMPGQMGHENTTVKNLEVVGTELDQNLVLIKGALPGANHSRIYIYPHSNDFENKVLAANKPAGEVGENKEVENA
ncbi:50S ribosomal protein L3 [bacterium]|nr:50S ribosomal protein L3 [bacterium]MBU1919119.1 50S ribosomal protein L3 [bacterium]